MNSTAYDRERPAHGRERLSLTRSVAHTMRTRNVLPLGLVALAALSSGCVTGMTVEHAEENDKPAFYALMPLTVAADTALLPVYIPWLIGVNIGLFSEH
jgi:hypothetical protein